MNFIPACRSGSLGFATLINEMFRFDRDPEFLCSRIVSRGGCLTAIAYAGIGTFIHWTADIIFVIGDFVTDRLLLSGRMNGTQQRTDKAV